MMGGSGMSNGPAAAGITEERLTKLWNDVEQRLFALCNELERLNQKREYDLAIEATADISDLIVAVVDEAAAAEGAPAEAGSDGDDDQ